MRFEEWGLRWSRSRIVDGLWVGAMGVDDDVVLARVEEALRLIKHHDPIRYNRLIRDLERIWVHLLPGNHGQFNAAIAACELDTRFVLADPPEFVAAAIVHEATHARLWRRGIEYDLALRERVEAACVRREIAFAARLPAGEDARLAAEAHLETPPELWSDEAFARRRREGEIEMARHIGIPEWLIRAAPTIRRFVHRVRAIARWPAAAVRAIARVALPVLRRDRVSSSSARPAAPPRPTCRSPSG
jgi:hypothetical protein